MADYIGLAQGCSPEKKKWGGRLKQDLDKDFLNNLGLHTCCTETVLHCVSVSNQLQQWTNFCTNFSPKKWRKWGCVPPVEKSGGYRPPESRPTTPLAWQAHGPTTNQAGDQTHMVWIKMLHFCFDYCKILSASDFSMYCCWHWIDHLALIVMFPLNWFLGCSVGANMIISNHSEVRELPANFPSYDSSSVQVLHTVSFMLVIY